MLRGSKNLILTAWHSNVRIAAHRNFKLKPGTEIRYVVTVSKIRVSGVSIANINQLPHKLIHVVDSGLHSLGVKTVVEIRKSVPRLLVVLVRGSHLLHKKV